MIRLFSKRHERAILKKDLVLSARLRQQIWTILEQFNFAFETPGSASDGWIEVTDVFASVIEELEQTYGQQFWTFNDGGDRVSINLEGCVKGADPAQILDVVELFYCYVGDAHKLDFQRTINNAFEEEKSNWRLADGQFFRAIPAVPPMQVTAQSDELPEGKRYEIALDRFHEAQHDLESGDYKGATNNALKSFESVLKCILGRDSGKANSLTGELEQNGFRPDLPERVGCAFGQQVLDSLSFLRSALAGNGQELETLNVRKEYAELSVHLATSFMFFATNLIFKAPSTRRASSEAPKPARVV